MDDSDFCLFESEIEELYQKKEKPTVTLTIEEAKMVHDLYVHLQDKLPQEGIEFLLSLGNRIKRAEGKR